MRNHRRWPTLTARLPGARRETHDRSHRTSLAATLVRTARLAHVRRGAGVPRRSVRSTSTRSVLRAAGFINSTWHSYKDAPPILLAKSRPLSCACEHRCRNPRAGIETTAAPALASRYARSGYLSVDWRTIDTSTYPSRRGPACVPPRRPFRRGHAFRRYRPGVSPPTSPTSLAIADLQAHRGPSSLQANVLLAAFQEATRFTTPRAALRTPRPTLALRRRAGGRLATTPSKACETLFARTILARDGQSRAQSTYAGLSLTRSRDDGPRDSGFEYASLTIDHSSCRGATTIESRHRRI